MKRRSVLGVVAGGIAGLAGCSEQRSRAKYLTTDEFPDSDEVNRKCEIKPTRETAGTINTTLKGLFNPFVFSVSGRDDLRGYNQTFAVTMTAEQPVNVFIVNEEEREQLIKHEETSYYANKQKNGTSKGGNTTTTTENESTTSTESDNTSTTNKSDARSLLESVSRPESAEIIATDVTETSFTTRVALSQTKNMVFTPTNETVSELPVTVSLSMDCRYFLPYEEYKEYQANNSE